MEMSVIQFDFHLIHVKVFHARSLGASLLMEAAFVTQLLNRRQRWSPVFLTVRTLQLYQLV